MARLAAFHPSAWTARRRFAFACTLAALVIGGETSEAAVFAGFQAAVSFAVGRLPESVAVADLDGDTFPDWSPLAGFGARPT